MDECCFVLNKTLLDCQNSYVNYLENFIVSSTNLTTRDLKRDFSVYYFNLKNNKI